MKVVIYERIFTHCPLKRRSFWGWLFRVQNKDNAIIELKNAIADADRPSKVDHSFIEQIHAKYRFDIYREFALEITQLYLAFIKQVFSALADTELSNEDVADITALQDIFQIPSERVLQLNTKAGSEIYMRALKAALEDEILTDTEKARLLHLGNQLDLDKETSHTLYNRAIITLVKERVEDALEDGEFSPEEESHINTLCERFDIDLTFKKNTEIAVRDAKEVWRLKHGDLTPIPVSIQLKKGEVCYGCFNVRWLEIRRNAISTWNSRSFTKNLPTIAFTYAPIVEDCLTEIDSGKLYVTSKRIVFVGLANTTTIPFSKILRIDQFREGVRVHKETGRSPYIVSPDSIRLGILCKRLHCVL